MHGSIVYLLRMTAKSLQQSRHRVMARMQRWHSKASHSACETDGCKACGPWDPHAEQLPPKRLTIGTGAPPDMDPSAAGTGTQAAGMLHDLSSPGVPRCRVAARPLRGHYKTCPPFSFSVPVSACCSLGLPSYDSVGAGAAGAQRHPLQSTNTDGEAVPLDGSSNEVIAYAGSKPRIGPPVPPVDAH